MITASSFQPRPVSISIHSPKRQAKSSEGRVSCTVQYILFWIASRSAARLPAEPTSRAAFFVICFIRQFVEVCNPGSTQATRAGKGSEPRRNRRTVAEDQQPARDPAISAASLEPRAGCYCVPTARLKTNTGGGTLGNKVAKEIATGYTVGRFNNGIRQAEVAAIVKGRSSQAINLFHKAIIS